MIRRALPWLLIALLAALAWVNALDNAPVWDDRIYILDNVAVRDARWGEILGRPTGDYYRPVVFASFAIAGGGDPARFPAQIAANIAIHILCAWLFLAALLAFGATRGAALAAALVFALHPVQTEAVTYVSGRTDLLAALFSFAALLLHALARGWTGRAPRPALVAGAVACYALAIGSKESSLLLPGALFAGDLLFSRRTGRGAPKDAAALLARMLPYALVLAGYGAWRAHLGGGTVSIPDPETMGRTLPAALSAVGEYARLSLFPVNLHLERFVSASVPPLIAGAAFLAAALLALARGAGATRFWILWAAIAYLPAANLIPVYPGLTSGTIFAPEHFLYLPLTGILAACAPAIARDVPRRVAIPLLVGVLACFSLLVHDRNRDWRDEETLFRHTLHFTPGSARVRLNLGNLLLARGDARSAEAQYAEGARRQPEDVGLLLNLGIARMRLGHLGDAEKALRRATEIAPGDARAWATLGALHGNAGRPDDARRAFGRALAIDPANADAQHGMIILNRIQK